MPALVKKLCFGFICFCGFPSAAQAQSLGDPKLHVRALVSGLSQPTAMAFIGPGDILVLQKNDGRVRRVINGALQTGEVLDLAVETASERGLLGIAVHPNFSTNHFVYVYFTHSGTTCEPASPPPILPVNRICRYEWNGSALVNPTWIIDLPGTPGPNHNGGTMTFGPDGKLYVVIGDLNRNGELQNLSAGPAPDDTGVILRLNDDGSIPMDNPFYSQGGNLAKYYAYGVRNSFGLAFDPLTDRLWNTENGPVNYDEINLVQPGFNSGWERVMGPAGRDPQGTTDLVQFPGSIYGDPKFSWLSTVGPTALVFINSSRLGVEYQNHLFVGDINNGRLYRFGVNAPRNGFLFTAAALSDLVADNGTELQETILGTGFGGITDLKVGPDGNLYVLSFGLGNIFVILGTKTPADFDYDGTSDIVVERSGAWFFHDFDTGAQTGGIWTGAGPGCVPAPMDYDGDGTTNFTQFCNGAWLFFNAAGGLNKGIWTGGVVGDRPVPADYDGDGRDEVVVYRGGAWLFFSFNTGAFDPSKSKWTGGGVGCIPAPMDYDGDGAADFTQLCDGTWHFYNDDGSYNKGIWTGGIAGDVPVPADYDGDGIEDIVVFRGGAWLFYDFTTGAFDSVKSTWTGAPPHWTGGTSVPAPLDYDGDGKADFTVYSGGPWHFFNANGTYNKGIWTGGVIEDKAISRRLLP
jgi:glucose/arabinose dehydrogenase